MTPEPSSLADWTPEQIAQGKRWVQAWKEAGEVMEQLRRDELRATDTAHAMHRLAGAFESARWRGLHRPSSGLIEQQKLFLECHLRSRG